MWRVSQIICLGALAGLSVMDIRFRKIPGDILILGSIGIICYQCILRNMDIRLILGGILIGILFLGISKVTGEGIGYGDSWTILILGGYLGLWGIIEVLSGAFLLLVPAGIICMVRRKRGRSAALPFLPFLMMGYLMTLLVQGAAIW